MKLDEQPLKLYVQTPGWSSDVVVGESDLSFGYNKKMYLSNSPTMDTSEYFTPNMLGGSLTYQVDLSNVGCGCLTAFYAVSMPAVDNLDDPFKYCGSGTGAKAACPEFDIMEANMYGFHSTDHKCSSPNEEGVYTDCDANGECTLDVLKTEKDGVIQENLYGPG